MLRVAVIFLFVMVFAIYAWRNWFVSLCASIILMAFSQHPDVPRNIAGIQGLNFWNFLMFNVVLSWWSERKRLGHYWDVSEKLKGLFFCFLAVVLVAFVRLLLDPPQGYGAGEIISEYFINSLKYLIPGLLLLDGCRTRQRMKIALTVLMLFYVFLALQVIKVIPIGMALEGGASMSERAGRLLQRRVGYHRVSLSIMLSGASWALLAVAVLYTKKWHRLLAVAGAASIIMGQSLTGGRTGYVTTAAIGFTMCCLRWRKFLPLFPVAGIAILSLLPSVRERMFLGFGGTGRSGAETDLYDVSSGRNLAWPKVIEKIQGSPIIGYGRLAMIRTGVADWLYDELDEIFAHPHNAYLEMLLDGGIVGLALTLPIYLFLAWRSLRLFMDRGDPIFAAVGGASLALMLSWMIGCLGAVTLYPYEFTMGMWSVVGLMVRAITTPEDFIDQEVVEQEEAPPDTIPDFDREYFERA